MIRILALVVLAMPVIVAHPGHSVADASLVHALSSPSHGLLIVLAVVAAVAVVAWPYVGKVQRVFAAIRRGV